MILSTMWSGRTSLPYIRGYVSYGSEIWATGCFDTLASLELGLLARIDLPAAVPCASTSGPQPYYDVTISRYLETKTKQNIHNYARSWLSTIVVVP
jgi:hypothetical protein